MRRERERRSLWILAGGEEGINAKLFSTVKTLERRLRACGKTEPTALWRMENREC